MHIYIEPQISWSLERLKKRQGDLHCIKLIMVARWELGYSRLICINLSRKTFFLKIKTISIFTCINFRKLQNKFFSAKTNFSGLVKNVMEILPKLNLTKISPLRVIINMGGSSSLKLLYTSLVKEQKLKKQYCSENNEPCRYQRL